MFDPSVEKPIPLGQVPRIPWLPRRRRGKKVHVSTVFRWTQGLRGHRLEVVNVGGTRCTSEAALKRFFAALGGEDPADGVRTSTQAERSLREAERELEAAGY